MTGLDVLRRCQTYAQEMEQLKARIYFARDALTRCTRSTDAQGHGGDGDKMGELIARIDELERCAKAMETAHSFEVIEAAMLCGRLSDPLAARMMYGRLVEGQTMRQMMGELRLTSTDTAKTLYKRGRELLAETTSGLEKNEAYLRLVRESGRHDSRKGELKDA